MPVKLNSSGGGSVTLTPASTASDFTATFPAATGDVVTTGSSAVVTPAMLSTGAPSWNSSGNLSFNSGYGSVATAYGCRAWVNFDGTSNTANLNGTYSQSGTTVTVTATAHGLIVGSAVYADITSGTGVDGTYTVATVTDADTFTYTAGTSLTTSGNITLRRNTIRGSGNVTSITDNGVGDYTVNFTNAMPDVNYSTVATMSSVNGATTNRSIVILDPATYTTSAVRLLAATSAGTDEDPLYVCVNITR